MLDSETIHSHIRERNTLGADNYAPTVRSAVDAAQLLMALGSSELARTGRGPVNVLIAIDVEHLDDLAVAIEVKTFVGAMRTAISRFKRDMLKRQRSIRVFHTRFAGYKRYAQRPRFAILTMEYGEDKNVNHMLSGKGTIADLLTL